MADLTKIEKIKLGTVEIAKRVRKQLKEEFKGCKFSVTTQQFAGGSSISINMMKADILMVRDIDDISDAAIERLGTVYTREDVERMQGILYHQLNRHTLRGEYDSENWCNGVFLTEPGHKLLRRVIKIANQFNYDDSEPETDYYDVNYYLDIELGKWDKAFEDGADAKTIINPNWKGGTVEQTCEQCGKTFKVKPNMVGKTRFCSRNCMAKKYKEERRGEKHPCWKGGKIKRICEYCGNEFEVKVSAIKRGRGRFCSHSCNRKAQKMPTHHTKPELIFKAICQKYNLPFKYTGDGSFWIHNINPDFVNCNGKKIAVEIFGDYWHSPLLNTKLREDKTLLYRQKLLKRYGWKLIVFWETDLKREDAEQFVLMTLKEQQEL